MITVLSLDDLQRPGLQRNRILITAHPPVSRGQILQPQQQVRMIPSWAWTISSARTSTACASSNRPNRKNALPATPADWLPGDPRTVASLRHPPARSSNGTASPSRPIRR